MDIEAQSFHEATLRRIEAEIAELQAVARYHRRLLGVSEDAAAQSPAKANAPAGSRRDPMAEVSEGEFYGMSGPKATRALLERMGRSHPLKTREIFNAVKKGGVNVSSENVLYRSLFRESGQFHNVGRGVWGLRAWYPNAPLRSSKKGNGEPSDVLSDDDNPATTSDTETGGNDDAAT